MSEFRSDIAIGLLVTAVVAAGCTGKESISEPSPSSPTAPETGIGLRIQRCAQLGAFVFEADTSDRAANCEAASMMKKMIDSEHESEVSNSRFRMDIGGCVIYPLLTTLGGVEYAGTARVGKDGKAEVTAFKPSPPRNGQGSVENHVLQPGKSSYEITVNGRPVRVAVLASPDRCL